MRHFSKDFDPLSNKYYISIFSSDWDAAMCLIKQGPNGHLSILEEWESKGGDLDYSKKLTQWEEGFEISEILIPESGVLENGFVKANIHRRICNSITFWGFPSVLDVRPFTAEEGLQAYSMLLKEGKIAFRPEKSQFQVEARLKKAYKAKEISAPLGAYLQLLFHKVLPQTVELLITPVQDRGGSGGSFWYFCY